jgi:PAS domain S-box-containing protein
VQNNFARAGANIADHIHLLNSEGYWLSSPDKGAEWGFMRRHGRRFQDLYPEAWKRIEQGVSGQFTNREGLFSFETVTPNNVANQIIDARQSQAPSISTDAYRWKVVSRVAPDRVAPGPVVFLGQHLPLYLTIAVILLFGFWLLTTANIRHRRAEQQSAYERHFRKTFEDMQLATITVDLDYRMVFCNEYFLQLTGWRQDEIIGCDWIEHFVVRDQRRAVRDVLNHMGAESQLPRQIEADIQPRQGRRRLMAWHNTPSLDAQGRVIGVTMVGEDITERKRAEERVKTLSRAVEQSPSIVLLTDRSGLVEYVKMGMQILGKQASHDNKELAEIGLDQIHYMEEILTDMLTYARPEAVKTDWVNIRKIMDVTLSGLQRRIDKAEVIIETDYQTGLPMLLGDASKLRQLFSNLIVNALQSLEGQRPEQPCIRIRASQQMSEAGSAIEIHICDNGTGLNAPDAEMLFEPFVTTRSKGTGLGLVIVRQISQQHNGQVKLVARETGGACAQVVLPTRPPVTE